MGNEWKIVQLGTLVKIKGGKRLPKGSTLQQEKNSHSYIRVRDMGQRYLPETGLEYVPDVVFSSIKNYIVHENDVIISIVGTIGLVSIIDHRFHLASQTENCAKLSGLDEIDAHYLFYYLTSVQGQTEVFKGVVGAVQAKLPLYALDNLDVIWPERSIRTKISNKLRVIDDKIMLSIKTNKTLEQMAQALFKSWFVDFDPVIDNALAAGHAIPEALQHRVVVRQQAQALYASPEAAIKPLSEDIRNIFPSEFEESELGWIPEGWNVGCLDDMLVLQRGFDLPKPKRTVGKYPLIVASGQDGTHSEFKVKAPGVATGRSGKLGEVMLVQDDFWPLNTTLWIKEYKNSNPYHAYFLLNTLDLQKYNSGSAVPTLNRNHIHNLRLVVPNENVLDQFQLLVSNLFKKIKQNDFERESLKKLRDTLLPKLISGELTIPAAEAMVNNSVTPAQAGV